MPAPYYKVDKFVSTKVDVALSTIQVFCLHALSSTLFLCFPAPSLLRLGLLDSLSTCTSNPSISLSAKSLCYIYTSTSCEQLTIVDS